MYVYWKLWKKATNIFRCWLGSSNPSDFCQWIYNRSFKSEGKRLVGFPVINMNRLLIHCYRVLGNRNWTNFPLQYRTYSIPFLNSSPSTPRTSVKLPEFSVKKRGSCVWVSVPSFSNFWISSNGNPKPGLDQEGQSVFDSQIVEWKGYPPGN